VNKVFWVGKSALTPAVVIDTFVSEFGESCLPTSWSDYSLGNCSAESADVFIFDFCDGSQHSQAFSALASRSSETKPSLALIPSHFHRDSLLSISQLVDDVIQLPCAAELIVERVHRLLGAAPETETEQVTRKLIRELGLRQIVGQHPSLLAVLERIQIIARVDLPALIFGETGTGKELCARAIHALSARRDQPFVPVECGAIPNELAESELFGHARGAYTDARSATLGVVGMAEGGTLFLDEIDSLPQPVQAKLLRFLQEGTYRSLGSDKYKQADVRIIAASNRNLNRVVKEKTFREDLFFRLSVLRIDLPSLQQRSSDIPLLAAHFLEAAQAISPTGKKHFANDALAKLQQHLWPGNIRELSNVVNRAVLFSRSAAITARDIVFDDTSDHDSDPPAIVTHDFRSAKSNAVNAFEKAYLISLLQEHGGNISRAASAARQDRSSFRRLLKKHNLGPAVQF
jgi:two-component system, NtrC family, response regulator GlrR